MKIPKIELIPVDSYDSQSVASIIQLVKLASSLLEKEGIPLPNRIGFYNDLTLFIERVSPQVESYGFNKKQARELIKITLNNSTYGTFELKDNAIIEMNFNPYYQKFYPAIQFLELIIHESLHLLFYSVFHSKTYNYKFKFDEEKFVGNEKLIQLDEGFASFFTEKLIDKQLIDKIRTLPIYSQMTSPPVYKPVVDGLNLEKIDRIFTRIYEVNSTKGYKLMKQKFEASLEKFKGEKIRFIEEKVFPFIMKELELKQP